MFPGCASIQFRYLRACASSKTLSDVQAFTACANILGASIGRGLLNLQARTYLWYISLLRIYVGYYLLWQGIRKYQRDFTKGDWIGRQIGDIPALDLYPWYKRLLIDYVVPHHELFGYLVMVGEIG